jgi:hypothetical protein
MTLRGPLLFLFGLSTMLAAGWIGFPAMLYRQSAQPLQFNHRVHKEKASMDCATCHAIRDDATFAGIPKIESCGTCHSAALGTTQAEKQLVDEYVTPNREIPWKVYSRQPDNVRFSHATHVNRAKLQCERCHGGHGDTTQLRVYEQNRISGYSRDIWGHTMTRTGLRAGEGMKMTDCEGCHAEKGVETGCLACHK